MVPGSGIPSSATGRLRVIARANGFRRAARKVPGLRPEHAHSIVITAIAGPASRVGVLAIFFVIAYPGLF
jgi:hypothetical protein